VFSALAGRVARIFIGLTPGYYNPALSPEDVRDHFAEIMDERGYTTPSSANDEVAELSKLFGATAGGG
jgi:hypothetical protein